MAAVALEPLPRLETEPAAAAVDARLAVVFLLREVSKSSSSLLAASSSLSARSMAAAYFSIFERGTGGARGVVGTRKLGHRS